MELTYAQKQEIFKNGFCQGSWRCATSDGGSSPPVNQ